MDDKMLKRFFGLSDNQLKLMNICENRKIINTSRNHGLKFVICNMD